MAEITQPIFWSDAHRRYLEDMGGTALDIIFAGASSGIELMPAGFELLINWDYFNRNAIQWLKDWGLTTAQGITDTTRKDVIQLFDDWIQSGNPLDTLIGRLSQVPTFTPERAERIAVTETTRMFAEGNIMAWKSTGYIGGKRWNTARDERVCPICGPLDGKIVSIDSGWSADEEGAIVESDLGLLAPPAHTNCRCWLTPFVDVELVGEEIRRVLNA